MGVDNSRTNANLHLTPESAQHNAGGPRALDCYPGARIFLLFPDAPFCLLSCSLTYYCFPSLSAMQRFFLLIKWHQCFTTKGNIFIFSMESFLNLVLSSMDKSEIRHMQYPLNDTCNIHSTNFSLTKVRMSS